MDPKFRSKKNNPNMDLDTEVTPPKLTLIGTHMVIKTLDGSSCKTCIISTSAAYMWHMLEN